MKVTITAAFVLMLAGCATVTPVPELVFPAPPTDLMTPVTPLKTIQKPVLPTSADVKDVAITK